MDQMDGVINNSPQTSLGVWREFIQNSQAPMWISEGDSIAAANAAAARLLGAEKAATLEGVRLRRLISGNSSSEESPRSANITGLDGTNLTVNIASWPVEGGLRIFHAALPASTDSPTDMLEVLKRMQLVESAERSVLETAASDGPIREVLVAICKLGDLLAKGYGACGVFFVDSFTPEVQVVDCDSEVLLSGGNPDRDSLEIKAKELGQSRGSEHTLYMPLEGSDGHFLGAMVFWIKVRDVDLDSLRRELAPSVNLAALALTKESNRRRLLSKQARLAAISRAAPIGLYHWEGSRRLVYANDRFYQMTGVSSNDYSAHSWFEAVHPEDRAHVEEAWKAACDSKSEFRAECRIANPQTPEEGQWVMCVEIPSGTGRIGTITDISELKRAQTALIESEEKFRTLANSISQFCWIADKGGSIFWYNDRWYEYTGTTLEEMQGWGWRAVHHPEHVDRVVGKLSAAWLSGEEWEDVFPLRGKDGNYRWFLSRALPIRDARGQVKCWFGTNTDITELRELQVALRRQNQALNQSNEDLNRFAFVASHDLKEPLRTVSTNSQLVRRSLEHSLDARGKGLLDGVVEACSRMNRLISDLLIYAQVSDTSTHGAATTDLNALVPQVLNAMRTQIEEARAEITHDWLPTVCGTEFQLSQLLTNLLTNSLKYRKPEIQPRIHIACQKKGECWRISVTDNGQGFDPAHGQRIFGFFERLHGNEVPGTGLGLAICKAIVERNGGSIGAEGKLGEGATVWFILPECRPGG